jgi:hypothetical protein
MDAQNVAPVRVWREGDPPPESTVALLGSDGVVSMWDLDWHSPRDWPAFLAERHGLQVEIHVDYDAVVADDAARRDFTAHADGGVTTLQAESEDAEVQARIDGPDDVCLDPPHARDLISDRHRHAVILWAGGPRFSRPASVSTTVLTTEQVACALEVSREYVRRIPNLQAGYPAEQVIARLVHLGRSRADAEAAIAAVTGTGEGTP